jgi:hypothetical protein
MSKIEEKDTDKGCHFARERENLLRPKLLTKYIGRFFQEVLSDTSTNNICRSKVVSVTNRKGGETSVNVTGESLFDAADWITLSTDLEQMMCTKYNSGPAGAQVNEIQEEALASS